MIQAGELSDDRNVVVRQRLIEVPDEGLCNLSCHLLLWAKDPQPVHDA